MSTVIQVKMKNSNHTANHWYSNCQPCVTGTLSQARATAYAVAMCIPQRDLPVSL